MMIESVLVVCVGNICRSPLGERMLQAELGDRGAPVRVSSAGLQAMAGYPADIETSMVARKNGVSLDGHIARQFSRYLGREHDLILVMEPAHKADILRTDPALSGKTFLFDQWTGGKGIADPYHRSREFHEAVFAMIRDAARAWAEKLAVTGPSRN